VLYDVNIVAHMEDGTEVAYKVSQFTHPGASAGGGGGGNNNGGGTLQLVLGISIPLFLICMAAIVYLVVKNRKLTRELEVEMHDVPIRLGGEISTTPITSHMARDKTQKYSRLLSEMDDEDDEKFDEVGDFASLPEV